MMIGVRIRLIRLARGYTIAELARRSELSAAYLSQIERGVMNPNAEQVESIAKALGLQHERLYMTASGLNVRVEMADLLSMLEAG